MFIYLFIYEEVCFILDAYIYVFPRICIFVHVDVDLSTYLFWMLNSSAGRVFFSILPHGVHHMFWFNPYSVRNLPGWLRLGWLEIA